MSALAEALVAAQRTALAALQKQYVAGKFVDDVDGYFESLLLEIGLTDEVDAERLIAALDIIRKYGSALPAAATPAAEKPPEKATPAQIARIYRDFKSKGITPLAEQDIANLSKQRASDLIEALATDTYDVSAWDVPF